MGLSWRKLGSALKVGLSFAAMVEPHAALVAGLIEGVQEAMPDHPGADKKATVEAAADAVLGSALIDAATTPEQFAALKLARSTFIDAYVASRDAETKLADAKDALQAAIEAIKHG